jgi:predicted PurR-regulated permease PerM
VARKNSNATSRAANFTAFIVAIAALRLGQEVLMPFALAVLLSFLLAPAVIFLQRHVGRIFAVVGVSVVTFILVAAIAWFLLDQIGDLASKLPERKQNITNKIKAFRNSVKGRMGIATQTVEEITRELSSRPPAEDVLGPVLPVAKVVEPVQSRQASPGSGVLAWIETVLSPLGGVAVVAVFVIFILIYYDDLRDRILRLVGTGRLNQSTQAIDDAAGRVSRYLLMQSLINACHGLTVALGLYFIGLPSALFFGMTSALLRFIPYVGPVLAAAMPITLALAVFDGWTSPLTTVGFFIVLELLSNNVLEPWLYGSSTGLSPMAVILAAVFWSWLWGPVGLVLSAPLTVCLVVLGKHIAPLNFLNVLLSDQPVLEPKDRLYQRLLVMDQEGALDVAEKYLEEHTLEEVYDHVLLPALAMSEIDRHHGEHDEVHVKFIAEYMRELIEDLGEVSRQMEAKKAEKAAMDTPQAQPDPASRTSVNILCLPARDEADELAGIMFAQVLAREGHAARCISVDALAGEMMEVVEKEGVQIVCVSALPPSGVTHARYLCKRLRSRFDRLDILVGLWTTTADPLKALTRTTQDDFLKAVTSLAAGRELVDQLTQSLVLTHPANESRGPSNRLQRV